MTETVDELEEAIDRLEDSDEALQNWLQERQEAETLSRVLKPRRFGGSGVGSITIRVSKPGRKCYYTVRAGGQLFVKKSHPNSSGKTVPASEASGDLLRRAVEYYPQFLSKLVDRVNEEATKYEASLPDEPVPGLQVSE